MVNTQVSQLWVRWLTALSVFIFCHLLYLNYEAGLVDGDRNIIWYGFLAVLDMTMGLALLVFRFKPFSSAIAWLCLLSALINMGFGVFHVFSDVTPVWLDVALIELYGRITLAITGVQLLGFLIAGEQIGRYNGNTDHSIFRLFVDENNRSHVESLGK